jgi:DNA-binding response OmpR family regulator
MIVEESQNLRSVLKDYFEMNNYAVIDFGDGESAIRGYRNGCCDICLIEIGLRKKDGYAVLRELHCISPDLPVVFVSSKDGDEDRLKGFKAGCEDYVIKPFSMDELLLRMEAILKRCGKTPKKKGILNNEIIFQRGGFIFNYNEMKLINGEHVRILTRKETYLLKVLFEYKNKLVPREILLKEIWGDSKAAAGRSLDVFISKLRVYIKSEVVDILNIHGTGYLLKVRG